ncbi:MAG: zinc ribbon domain-containing protein [Desulfatiglans sp.]|nr:zinc ribbon domain-containing protein [Thermodesulfobacteriota bacterium]MEE4351598.1 zinc ribbon domain-containing protein [Desulfatiglans sp.]
MPIYEFECADCGQKTEILMAPTETDLVICHGCGSRNLKKLLSAHAAVSSDKGFPQDPSDRCCGTDTPPGTCAGPGSCCGRA